MIKAHCIWFTGLPAAGKSTLALELHKVLTENGRNVFVLDGDVLRKGLNADLGFSEKDRDENIRRVGHVARILYDAGNIVICAFISPTRKMREYVRNLFPEGAFTEVYLECSLEECKKRDPKGMYKKADAGDLKDFTGVSAPYEKPKRAELTIATDKLKVQESVEVLSKYVYKKMSWEN